jgi:hypothetical protein
MKCCFNVMLLFYHNHRLEVTSKILALSAKTKFNRTCLLPVVLLINEQKGHLRLPGFPYNLQECMQFMTIGDIYGMNIKVFSPS